MQNPNLRMITRHFLLKLAVESQDSPGAQKKEKKREEKNRISILPRFPPFFFSSFPPFFFFLPLNSPRLLFLLPYAGCRHFPLPPLPLLPLLTSPFALQYFFLSLAFAHNGLWAFLILTMPPLPESARERDRDGEREEASRPRLALSLLSLSLLSTFSRQGISPPAHI